MAKLIIILLFSITSFGFEVQYINKGDPAPYEGFIFDKEAEKSARQETVNLKHKLKTMEQLSVVKDRRIKVYKMGYEDATKELSKQQVKSYLWSVGGFTIGVGLSAIAVYSMKKVLK